MPHFHLTAVIIPDSFPISAIISASSAEAATAQLDALVTHELTARQQTLGYDTEELDVQPTNEPPNQPLNSKRPTVSLEDAARCALADLEGLAEHAAFDEHPLHQTIKELKAALNAIDEPLGEPQVFRAPTQAEESTQEFSAYLNVQLWAPESAVLEGNSILLSSGLRVRMQPVGELQDGETYRDLNNDELEALGITYDITESGLEKVNP